MSKPRARRKRDDVEAMAADMRRGLDRAVALGGLALKGLETLRAALDPKRVKVTRGAVKNAVRQGLHDRIEELFR